MPWLGCLLFIAAAYILVVLVRGIIQGVAWFRDEFLPDSRRRNQTREKTHRHSHDSHIKSEPGHRGKDGHVQSRTARSISTSLACFNPIRCLTPLAELAKRLVFRRRYDYWVAVALGENDPAKKVKLYSRALKLEPDYEPGWKLKAVALMELKEYAEAIACLDKVHPTATTWCKKSICCYHLKRYEEVVACFDKALAADADKDDPVFEEALSCKKAAEEALGAEPLGSMMRANVAKDLQEPSG